jgi:UDP-N-acetylglucosamine 2-epimerase (non-hydrolysing)
LNILVCFGTRPEAIKMAPICHELAKQKIPYKLCVTGQHREMLDQVLDFFELIPDYDLDLMKPNQGLNELSARILKGVNKVLVREKFDLVLVHGDTTTSTMTAIAAFHKGIKVGHIEAGLRTYNKRSPFPEELNRQLTGRIADYHYAPTKASKSNLLKEGVDDSSIIVTGNTITDALEFAVAKVSKNYRSESINILEKLVIPSKRLILITGHRRESFGQGFENLCNALLTIAKEPNIQMIYPVHLNPNVQDVVYKILGKSPNIHLIAPQEYPSFVWLMDKASLIISDSGGIQEEAPTLNVPVLVTRDTTERREGVDAGVSFLVGTKKETIVTKTLEILKNLDRFSNMKNPYGDGTSAKQIVTHISEEIK